LIFLRAARRGSRFDDPAPVWFGGAEGEELKSGERIQAKYLDPLMINMRPMAMIEAAATRSPRNLVLMESKEADSPVRNRAGTVPSPKKTMVKNPGSGCWVVAAFTTMAQESMQGKKPVANPRANLEIRRWDWKRGGKIFRQKDSGPGEGRENRETGMTFNRTSPRRTIRIPPPRVIPLRNPEKKRLKSASWATLAASVPRNP